MLIKELYDELIGSWEKYDYSRSFTVPSWYWNYSNFYNRTLIMRSRLAHGYKLDIIKDKDFLRQLIFERQNSIANAGGSKLEWSDYEKLLNNGVFLESLSDFMKSPDATGIHNLAIKWHDCLKYNRPLRVHRIAAVCNLNISSTADNTCFNQIFDFLTDKGIISPMATITGGPQTNEKLCFMWFKRNKHLMKELSKIFKTELASGETDSIWLSIFVWEMQCRLCGDNAQNINPSLKAILSKYLPSFP